MIRTEHKEIIGSETTAKKDVVVRNWRIATPRFVAILATIAVLTASLWTSSVQADFNLFGKKTATDNNADYQLTEKCGPWLITAFVFTGQDAQSYSKRLCQELRRDFKVNAYIYHKEIKQANEVQGRGIIDGYGQVKTMVHMKDPNVNGYVVFIGDFRDVDDSVAQATLEKVRTFRPKTLEYHGDFSSENPLAEDFAAHGLSNGRGPMGRAFLTRNPLLDPAAGTGEFLDPKVVNFNKNVKYSLLDCPGKFSVQIATFRGFRTINQNEIQKIKKTGEVNASNMMTLAEADKVAEKLTAILRKRGVEAYCFRDHFASIVTVGSFNESSYINPQTGKREALPAIQSIFQEYSATQDPSKGMGPESVQLKTIEGIPLDPAPFIINVPRAQTRTGSNSFWLSR